MADGTINRDEGAYMLSHTWDALLQKTPDGRGRGQPARPAGSDR